MLMVIGSSGLTPNSYAVEIDKSEAINWAFVEKVLVAEAASEGYEGMLAVAYVMKTRRWNLEGFSARNRNDLQDFYGRQPKRVRAYARRIIKGFASKQQSREQRDPTNGATHYENIEVFGIPWWAEGVEPVAVIGKHTFYKL